MAKLPVLKARELLTVLQRLGFVIHHQRGSHVQLKHTDGRRITIPMHVAKEIRRGTLRAIITDLGLTVDEFVEVLKSK
jgi:predicted RNA binding protein YcfA (HicA-like mRNA interferase family)